VVNKSGIGYHKGMKDTKKIIGEIQGLSKRVFVLAITERCLPGGRLSLFVIQDNQSASKLLALRGRQPQVVAIRD